MKTLITPADGYRRQRGGFTPTRRAFTMVELMTVLTIIIILITILIPTVSRVRRASQVTTVKQQINELQAAIERFYQDQHKFPGPLVDEVLYTGGRNTPSTPTFNINDAVSGSTLARIDRITQEENLALGLLGGLKWMPGPVLTFDINLMRDGKGMVGMNPSQPKKYPAYISPDPRILSDDYTNGQQRYVDGAGMADDSPIPQIVDKFPNPMPILYARARPGATGVVRDNINNIESPANARQYDLSDFYPYTGQFNGRSIGEGKTFRMKDYNPPASGDDLPHGLRQADSGNTLDKQTSPYPYDAFPYFRNPTIPPTIANNPETGTARSKDRFVLISAGADRVYGTDDDICSFGSVTE